MTDTTAQIFAFVIALAIISSIIDEEQFFSTLHSIHGDPERRELITRTVRPHFQLVRYFTVVGLLTIGLVALTLIYFGRIQLDLINADGERQAEAHATVLSSLQKNHQAATRQLLVQQAEASHRVTAQLVINALGQPALATLIEQAKMIPIETCRALTSANDAAGQDCRRALVARLKALPGHAAMHSRLGEVLKDSGLSELRLMDNRGFTVLALNPAQIGEDIGQVAEFQQFIQSGSPVSTQEKSVEAGATPSNTIQVTRLGFEVPGQYPMLVELSTELAAPPPVNTQMPAAKGTPAIVAGTDATSVIVAGMERSSSLLLVTVVALMLVLFGVLFMLVFRADRLSLKHEKALAETEEKLTASTLIANSSNLHPAIAGEISYGLGNVFGHIQSVQLALHNAKETLRIAAVMTRIIQGTPGDKLVLDIRVAKKQLAQAAEGKLDAQALHQALESAKTKICQITDMIEVDRAPQPI